MPLLKYVGPHDEVSVDGLGVVKRHESIDAPDELAGRPPVADKDGTVTDPGAGLLAQPDNWSVPAKKSTNNDKQES